MLKVLPTTVHHSRYRRGGNPYLVLDVAIGRPVIDQFDRCDDVVKAALSIRDQALAVIVVPEADRWTTVIKAAVRPVLDRLFRFLDLVHLDLAFDGALYAKREIVIGQLFDELESGAALYRVPLQHPVELIASESCTSPDWPQRSPEWG